MKYIIFLWKNYIIHIIKGYFVFKILFAAAKGIDVAKITDDKLKNESHDEENVKELPKIENAKSEKKKLSRYFSLNKKPVQHQEETSPKLQRAVF